MKNYNDFINEGKIISLKFFGDKPFTFTIRSFMTKDPNEKIEKFIKKLREYFDYEDCNRIKKTVLESPSYPMFFLVYMTYGNAGTKRSTIQFNTKYYRETSNDDNNYTLDEFLELGLEGIKEDIEAKEAANTYNL